jgi:membrane protease subunit HflK
MHMHDHHHHHHGPDDDTPLDPANQSLADALKTSFRILKLVMFAVLIFFLLSGVRKIQPNEQAVVLRFGKLLPKIQEHGLCWAFPPGIDEVIALPVKQSNQLDIDAQWFFLKRGEESRSTSDITRGNKQGLDPVRDGGLMTGDRGLVHIRWKLVYQITDIRKFVGTIIDAKMEEGERLIERVLLDSATRVAAGYTAVDVYKRASTKFQEDVYREVNEILESLGSGLAVTSLNMRDATPPIQTRPAFDSVIAEESRKTTAITEARNKAGQLLNETAGQSYRKLIGAIDQADEARKHGDESTLASAEAEIDRILEFEATGEAARLIRDARAFNTTAVQRITADADQYEMLREEFETAPTQLVQRLWSDAYRKLLAQKIEKTHLPATLPELRITLEPDKQQRLADEAEKILKDDHDSFSGETAHYDPVP